MAAQSTTVAASGGSIIGADAVGQGAGHPSHGLGVFLDNVAATSTSVAVADTLLPEEAWKWVEKPVPVAASGVPLTGAGARTHCRYDAALKTWRMRVWPPPPGAAAERHDFALLFSWLTQSTAAVRSKTKDLATTNAEPGGAKARGTQLAPSAGRQSPVPAPPAEDAAEPEATHDAMQRQVDRLRTLHTIGLHELLRMLRSRPSTCDVAETLRSLSWEQALLLGGAHAEMGSVLTQWRRQSDALAAEVAAVEQQVQREHQQLTDMVASAATLRRFLADVEDFLDLPVPPSELALEGVHLLGPAAASLLSNPRSAAAGGRLGVAAGAFGQLKLLRSVSEEGELATDSDAPSWGFSDSPTRSGGTAGPAGYTATGTRSASHSASAAAGVSGEEYTASHGGEGLHVPPLHFGASGGPASGAHVYEVRHGSVSTARGASAAAGGTGRLPGPETDAPSRQTSRGRLASAGSVSSVAPDGALLPSRDGSTGRGRARGSLVGSGGMKSARERPPTPRYERTPVEETALQAKLTARIRGPTAAAQEAAARARAASAEDAASTGFYAGSGLSADATPAPLLTSAASGAAGPKRRFTTRAQALADDLKSPAAAAAAAIERAFSPNGALARGARAAARSDKGASSAVAGGTATGPDDEEEDEEAAAAKLAYGSRAMTGGLSRRVTSSRDIVSMLTRRRGGRSGSDSTEGGGGGQNAGEGAEEGAGSAASSVSDASARSHGDEDSVGSRGSSLLGGDDSSTFDSDSEFSSDEGGDSAAAPPRAVVPAPVKAVPSVTSADSLASGAISGGRRGSVSGTAIPALNTGSLGSTGPATPACIPGAAASPISGQLSASNASGAAASGTAPLGSAAKGQHQVVLNDDEPDRIVVVMPAETAFNQTVLSARRPTSRPGHSAAGASRRLGTVAEGLYESLGATADGSDTGDSDDEGQDAGEDGMEGSFGGCVAPADAEAALLRIDGHPARARIATRAAEAKAAAEAAARAQAAAEKTAAAAKRVAARRARKRARRQAREAVEANARKLSQQLVHGDLTSAIMDSLPALKGAFARHADVVDGLKDSLIGSARGSGRRGSGGADADVERRTGDAGSGSDSDAPAATPRIPADVAVMTDEQLRAEVAVLVRSLRGYGCAIERLHSRAVRKALEAEKVATGEGAAATDTSVVREDTRSKDEEVQTAWEATPAGVAAAELIAQAAAGKL